jgi:hypothetical protein
VTDRQVSGQPADGTTGGTNPIGGTYEPYLGTPASDGLFLKSTAAGARSWGAVLANPMSALGDTIYGGVVGAATALSGNTTAARKFLRQTGTGSASAAPAWDTVTIADLGGTTVGGNFLTLANPSAIAFPRINADNTVTALSDSAFRTAIGAGTSSFDGTWGSLSGKPANVVSFGSLANAAGWLHNDGAGTLAYSTPTAAQIGAEPALGNPGTTGWVLSSTTAGVRSWVAQSGGASGANPTASVGLSAVNGSAATFMRSDAAPSLDVSISPTWTGTHTFGSGKLIGTNLTGPAATDLSLLAGSGNQNVILTPSGSGIVSIGTTDLVLTDNTTYRTWQGRSTAVGWGYMVQRTGATAGFAGLGVGQSVYYEGQLASGAYSGLTAVVASRVVQYILRGYDGANWQAGASMQFNVLETWSGSARGCEINWTAYTSATTTAVTMKFSNAGNLLIGGTADTGLTGAGGLSVFSTTASSSKTTGSAIFGGGVGIAGAVYANSAVLTTALAISSGGTGLTSTSQNYVFLGPVSGGSGAPTWRGLALADFPSIANNTILGNTSGGSAAPSALTGANVRTICGLATTDSPTFVALTTSAVAALTTAAESWVGPSSTAGIYFKGGNVGIGTTGPGASLEVFGSGTTVPLQVDANSNAQTFRAYRNGNTVGWGVDGFSLYMNNSAGTPTQYALIGAGILQNTAGSEGGRLSFHVDESGTLTEAMRIDNHGNVGIGTTAPAYTLDVAGNCNISTGSHFKVNGVNLAAADVGAAASTSFIAGAGALTGPASPLTIGTAAGHADSYFHLAAIAANEVTLAMMASLAANSILGNNTGSAATPLALTIAQTKTLLALAQADVSGLTVTDSPTFANITMSGSLYFTGANFTWTPVTAGTLRFTSTQAYNFIQCYDGSGSYAISLYDGATEKVRIWAGNQYWFYGAPVLLDNSITTGAPAGGTAGAWKMGIWVNTPTIPTGYIQVDVAGTLYEIPAKVH